MSFNVAATAYDRFMGRFSRPLSIEFADWLDLHEGQKALDVGCGPGALTEVLADRLGAASVTGVDPSEPFVEAARERLARRHRGPGVGRVAARSTTASSIAPSRSWSCTSWRPGRPRCASCVA